MCIRDSPTAHRVGRAVGLGEAHGPRGAPGIEEGPGAAGPARGAGCGRLGPGHPACTRPAGFGGE
eukprot:2843740-Alexandrium_andersonii.AAC.1